MLARVFVSGEQTIEGICERAAVTLGRDWKWMRGLARRFLAAHAGEIRPREQEARAFFEQDRGCRRACKRFGNKVRVARWLAAHPQMAPISIAKDWLLPVLETEGELASWLGVSEGELEWFADLRQLSRAPKCAREVRHFHYCWTEKRSGGLRLLESPKERMKGLQRQILRQVLDRVPHHAAAHGFVKERSIKSFAAAHQRRFVVLRMDLKDFFPSVRRARVQSVFRMLGYPERVADLLGGICTTTTPRDVWHAVRREEQDEVRRLYGQSHLPQGAPTSPALGNICCYRLDCRLSGLACAAGGWYTRYADDLAFSGDEEFARGLASFVARVRAVAEEEGLQVNHRKTRIMRRGARQQLAGLVVNGGVGIGRGEFDRLKAILTNCARNGAERENRDGRASFREYLEGRVAFMTMIDAERSSRLRRIFDRVDWSPTP